jgi:hypothetical protein
MRWVIWGCYTTFLVLKCIKTNKRCLFLKRCMLKKFRMFGCKPMATPLAVNEKLKKEDGGKNVNATLYRNWLETCYIS